MPAAGIWPALRRVGAALLLTLALPLAASEQTRTLMVLGDSLSAAYGIDMQAGWVALLQARLSAQGHAWRVVNASVSGDTSAGGLTRLPAALEQHRPALVVVELGGNDGLRGIDFNTTEHNLDVIIETSLAAGAEVLLVGIQLPPNFGEAFNQRFVQVFHDLAERRGVPLVPFLLEGVGGVDTLMQDDGIHPTAQAQPMLLDNVWPVLEPLL